MSYIYIFLLWHKVCWTIFCVRLSRFINLYTAHYVREAKLQQCRHTETLGNHVEAHRVSNLSPGPSVRNTNKYHLKGKLRTISSMF